MVNAIQPGLITPEEAAQQAAKATAPNGIRYATLGRMDGPHTSPAEIARLVGTVPSGVAAGLSRFAYLFVPLTFSAARLQGDEPASFGTDDQTFVATAFDATLAERAICHRNARVGDTEYVFLSSRLHSDQFALAFEFCINVAHNFVDHTAIPVDFTDLLWKQIAANVRGETSVDAWEERAEALGQPVPASGSPAPMVTRSTRIDEKARSAYQATAFADALAIYLLSLFLDFDYADLREREYPLLAAPALAERLRAIHKLFPPNDGYQFQILYRRRT